MTHSIGSLIAADDLTLFTRRWTPAGDVRAHVVLVHGVHEHSGRYAALATALMRRRLAVHALDLRGHGRSHGPRGQVEGFDQYVDDVSAFVSEVRAEAGDAPVFLMGHSMGGLVVASTVAHRGTDGLAGVVLSSPALALDGTPKVLEALAPFVARWLPDVPVTRLDLGRLSRDPAVVRAYREDRLTIKRGVRARLGYGIVRAIEAVRQRPEAFDVPLYLFHGDADTITDPAGTRWLADHAASDDVTLRLWPGLYHETLNEPERDEVIAELADWLDAHVG
ncbi:lysophospholipase [Rubrivirga sp.]|uniref:alpha/beta hydrolase n=1 Tax=Rubrivirga sp. TaxID=1885344 RepID=UPI003B5173BE